MARQGTYDGINWVELREGEDPRNYKIIRDVGPRENQVRQVDKRELFRKFITEQLKKAALNFDYTHAFSDDSIVVCGVTGINFEVLQRVSEILGTKQINICCDMGTSSDHSHETELHIGGLGLPKG